jgi:hypothetical protein
MIHFVLAQDLGIRIGGIKTSAVLKIFVTFASYMVLVESSLYSLVMRKTICSKLESSAVSSGCVRVVVGAAGDNDC